MGSFYTNYVLKGPEQKQIADFLKGERAIVSPTINGCTVVFEEESENQDAAVMKKWVVKLSAQLQCPVLGVVNHDDDILGYYLGHKGQVVDQYDSNPDYFSGEGDGNPVGGNAALLCDLFQFGNKGEVEDILRKNLDDDDAYIFAVDRHLDLANALNMPEFVAGTGFNYFLEDGTIEGYHSRDFFRTY